MFLGKRLRGYIARYWFMYLLGVIALVAVDWVQLFQPIYLGQIVDALSAGTADAAFITPLCLRLLAVAAVMFAGRMLWRFTLFGASQRIEEGLRREMFLKSERLSQQYYQKTKVGAIMSWFTTDLEEIREFTGFGTVQLVDSAFLGILVIVRMLLLDPVMTVFALVPMLLIIVWGALMERLMAKMWKERQEHFDRLYDFAQENFTGIGVIKAFVKETKECLAFAKVARENRDANVRFARFNVGFDTLIELIIALILSLILGFGSWFAVGAVTGDPVRIFGHEILLTPGKLITFIGYFDTLIWPMIALGSLFAMLGRARASMRRVDDFLNAPEDVKDAASAEPLVSPKGAVEFRHCSFAYPSAADVPVLRDVSLKIEPGELIGVVGRVGSGKTTLVTLLTRLWNVPLGTVFIDGHDVMECTLESVRRAVAVVPQDNFLFSDTVEGNIAFGAESPSHEDVVRAAEFADVAANIDSFPNGYETLTGERGVTLSGGQKQRVSLARAFLRDAPIMILDDSVSAVDVDTEETILRNIRRERAGRTTIIIASRASTVARADRIAVLNAGALEAFDTPARLAEISPTYRTMVRLQELEREVKG